MVDAFTAAHDLHQGPITIRALRSLRTGDINEIARTVGDFGDRWIAHAHDDYEGYLSIVIEPVGADQNRPSYIVSGSAGRIELAQVEDDDLREIGVFDNVAEAVASLTSLLED